MLQAADSAVLAVLAEQATGERRVALVPRDVEKLAIRPFRNSHAKSDANKGIINQCVTLNQNHNPLIYKHIQLFAASQA